MFGDVFGFGTAAAEFLDALLDGEVADGEDVGHLAVEHGAHVGGPDAESPDGGDSIDEFGVVGLFQDFGGEFVGGEGSVQFG